MRCRSDSKYSSRRLLWHGGARQRNPCAQARRIVLELEFAAMEPRHGRHEAQAKSGPRMGPALLQAHEAVDHARAVALGNARAVVAYRQHDLVLVGARL